MFRFVTNPKARIVVSLVAAFGIGLLISGGLADMFGMGPISQLLLVLAAMPLLAFGFYLNLTAYAARLEQR